MIVCSTRTATQSRGSRASVARWFAHSLRGPVTKAIFAALRGGSLLSLMTGAHVAPRPPATPVERCGTVPAGPVTETGLSSESKNPGQRST
jgi:hypothetical protein